MNSLVNNLANIFRSFLIALTSILAPCNFIYPQSSNLIFVGNDGKLQYTLFSNTGETNEVNLIPDFSFAGYKFGGVILPVLPVVKTLSPLPGDNFEQIQDAINKVSALPLDKNGFRGAILLKAGKYDISTPLIINAGGVVLRGEGQMPADQGGTELYSTAAFQHDFITFKNSGDFSSTGSLLDTIIVPKKNLEDPLNPVDGKVWLSCNLLSAAAKEFAGDKVLSVHFTADDNDFVSYNSKDNTAGSIPYLILKLHLKDEPKDTIFILNPSDDAYVQGGEFSKTNFGNDKNLSIKNAGDDNRVTREIFIKFILPALNAEVLSADLYMYCNNAGDNMTLLNFVTSISNDNWSENTITYSNRPNLIASQRITTSYVPSGASTFSMADATAFKEGDPVMIVRTPNDNWIKALDMAQYGWIANDYRISYERKITSVKGNVVSIDIPLVQSIADIYGGGEMVLNTQSARINNCGIENLFISSYYATEDDEQHGWTAVVFNGTKDCWAQNVTARYFGYACVEIVGAFTTTVQECATLDPKSITTGGRKYPFNIEKGSFNLFQRCYARGGRHSFATGSRVAGPNVFVDCLAEQTFADIGPHHRYATGTLFDNIRGGQTRVQNRKDMGSGHGWAGAQTMFWNLEAIDSDIMVDSPLGAMNWGIGCSGPVKNGNGYWEKWGTHVLPRSLYLKQLEDRMGVQAVYNIATQAQLNGRIWDALRSWQGIGSLKDSLPSNNSMLADLKMNDTSLVGFHPAIKIYSLKIKAGTLAFPKLTWNCYDTAARVQFRPANEIPDTAIITVTAGDGITKSVYKIIFARFSDNAYLKDIKVNGITVINFNPEILTYEIEFPSGTSTVPVITYIPDDSNSKSEISNSPNIPGNSTIKVIAEDQVTIKTYTVHFTIKTGVRTNNRFQIKMYPNPAYNEIIIESPEFMYELPLLTISNFLGQVVFSKQTEGIITRIPINYLNNGFYQVNMFTGKDIIWRKFFIKSNSPTNL